MNLAEPIVMTLSIFVALYVGSLLACMPIY